MSGDLAIVIKRLSFRMESLCASSFMYRENDADWDQRVLRDWISKARNGDASAFEYIVRRHERLVLRTAQKMLGNGEDAKDAAQELFLRLHRNLHEFQEHRELMPWLYRMTVNVCLDILRKRKTEGLSKDQVKHAIDERSNPEEELEIARRRELLVTALLQLSSKERAAIVLRDIEGCTTAEVATILRSSEATVRSQISTGRTKIKAFLEARLRRNT
jgi:RNA polymerase sigma-70 factor, ECF subfamily